jgi:Uncharacterised protein family (UPF0175)
MNVTIRIPDDLAARLAETGDLGRRALEALASEEYRAGRLSHPEVRRLLGFGTHAELDGFLKRHGLFADYALADLDQELEDMRRIGV